MLSQYFNRACYLALVGKSPYSGCNLNGKYDKQEEEKLHKEKTKFNSVARVHVWTCKVI